MAGPLTLMLSRAVEYRPATVADIQGIARLHAESWRRSYRGVYSDEFLDADVDTDRLAVWTARLTEPGAADVTTVAVDAGTIVGFVHTTVHDHPTWGALLDNLHVSHEHKRRGVGSELMARSAAAVLACPPATGVYLWVLEANTAARAFYEDRGGTCVERETSEPPGGGSVVGLRYAWPDATVLLRPDRWAGAS
jgi:ribosomal protein S18 acetylase RimI-like enzyme